MTGIEMPDETEVLLSSHSVERFLERNKTPVRGCGGNDLFDSIMYKGLPNKGVSFNLEDVQRISQVEKEDTVEDFIRQHPDSQEIRRAIMEVTAEKFNEEVPEIGCYETDDPRNIGLLYEEKIGGRLPLFPKKSGFIAKTYLNGSPKENGEGHLKDIDVSWGYQEA
ncbi:MAG: hypothetical protein ACLFTQ_00680 [Candidatus Aenigmatarchaeota archaeon]